MARQTVKVNIPTKWKSLSWYVELDACAAAFRRAEMPLAANGGSHSPIEKAAIDLAISESAALLRYADCSV
ncbi:MAG: hypothetical protein ACLGHK_04705 [Alphaproteobacteria bacterium]